MCVLCVVASAAAIWSEERIDNVLWFEIHMLGPSVRDAGTAVWSDGITPVRSAMQRRPELAPARYPHPHQPHGPSSRHVAQRVLWNEGLCYGLRI